MTPPPSFSQLSALNSQRGSKKSTAGRAGPLGPPRIPLRKRIPNGAPSGRALPCQTASQPPRAACGFNLIELLTVVAVSGILVSILVPTLSAARTAANKARTRTQFSQWGAAFEAFRQEYGSYPQLSTQGAQKLINPPGTSTNTQQVHLFHDTLTGHRRDPSGTWPTTTTGTPPPPQAQNTRRIQFVAFTDDDFVLSSDVTNGYNIAGQLNWIRDGFHNTSIAVITDANLDGVINGRDTTGGFPRVTPASGTITPLAPATTDLPTGNTGGVHAGVIFYCAPPGASTSADLIMSWK